MKSTYLVQRLKAPPKSEFHAKASRVFGGGMLQLSDEAWEILQSIFDIDYMGSSEFEFGVLPKSLKEFARSHESLTDFSMRVSSKLVYVLCRQTHREEVEKRIIDLSLNKTHTKCDTRFLASLAETADILGWYELDNGFFFFLDEEMWKKTIRLFKEGT